MRFLLYGMSDSKRLKLAPLKSLDIEEMVGCESRIVSSLSSIIRPHIGSWDGIRDLPAKFCLQWSQRAHVPSYWTALLQLMQLIHMYVLPAAFLAGLENIQPIVDSR